MSKVSLADSYSVRTDVLPLGDVGQNGQRHSGLKPVVSVMPLICRWL